MNDAKIERVSGQYGVVLEDGDLVLHDESTDEGYALAVVDRCIYTLMTWLGECVYQRSAGLPHEQVLGSLGQIAGIAGLYVAALQDVEGADEIEDFTMTEPTGADPTLTLDVKVRVRGKPFDVAGKVAA
jgi:hypothetical protein